VTLTEEFIKDKINPIVGYLVHSGRGAAMCGLPDSADWEYLREGTARIKALLESELLKAEQENAKLRQRLLTAAGDDLCRLSQEEIKQLTSGYVQIPPKCEFLASCERFHSQMAGEAGINQSCLTSAQMAAEITRLESRVKELESPCPSS